jgi:acetyl/propionyl-CoA carboxylase alpha subunit
MRRAMGEQATSLAKAVGYNSAGQLLQIFMFRMRTKSMIFKKKSF